MYTRIYNQDGTSYALETKYFDIRDIEDGRTYVSDLTAEYLTDNEIINILEQDAEGANYHSLIRQYQVIYDMLKDATYGIEQSELIIKRFMVLLLENGGLID